MPDSNLSTSIAAVKTKITTDAPTATVDEILSLARAAKSVGLSEDAAVESAINSRVLTLSSGATTANMVKLANVIKQVRDATSSSGLTDISQLTDTTNLLSSGGGRAGVYADMAALIAKTGMVAGDTALVTALNKVFMYTGSAWFLIATMTNSSPTNITGVNSTYSLATDGTATVITAVSTDPEGFALTWSYAVTTGSLGSTATVSQADNVFTITPSTTEADAGTFSITFSVTDGATGAVSAVSAFSLNFYTQGSSLFGRWDIGNSTSYSGTGTTWNDLSGNGRNLTIQNGAYNSSGINGSTAVWDWTTQNSAQIDFPTDISSVKTFIVIWGFTSTTPNTRLIILNGNSTGNYAGFTDANDPANIVYSGITAHTGETIDMTMNGNSVTTPAVLYNGMQQGYLNLFALRGAKFTDSTAKYANYFGYNHPHQLRAILMWDVMLTDSEIKDVYDTFPASAMATWDG